MDMWSQPMAADKLNKSVVISIQQTNNLPLAGYIIATDVAKATNAIDGISTDCTDSCKAIHHKFLSSSMLELSS